MDLPFQQFHLERIFSPYFAGGGAEHIHLCLHLSPPSSTDFIWVTRNFRIFYHRVWKDPGAWGCHSVAFTISLGKTGPNREQRMAATQPMNYLSMMIPEGPVATLTLAYNCDYIKGKASTGAFLFHSSAVTIPLVTEHIKGTLTHYLQLQFLKSSPGFPLLLSEHIPLLRVSAVEIN